MKRMCCQTIKRMCRHMACGTMLQTACSMQEKVKELRSLLWPLRLNSGVEQKTVLDEQQAYIILAYSNRPFRVASVIGNHRQNNG